VQMKRLVVFALMLGVFVSLGAGNASASSGRSAPVLRSPGGSVTASQLHARYANPVTHISTARALVQAAAGTTVHMFHHNQVDGGTTYNYTMVGTNPFSTGANNTQTTPVWIYPIKFQFSSFGGETFDPTAANACDSANK